MPFSKANQVMYTGKHHKRTIVLSCHRQNKQKAVTQNWDIPESREIIISIPVSRIKEKMESRGRKKIESRITH